MPAPAHLLLMAAGGGGAASPPQGIGWDATSGGNGSGMDFSNPLSGSGVQAGDILIVHWTGTSFGNNVPSNPGGGWSTIVSHRTGSNNPVAIYGKVASGSETNESWGSSASGYKWMALIIRGGSGWTNAACVGDATVTTGGVAKTPATVSGVGASDLRLQMVTTSQAAGQTLIKTGAAWSDAVTPQVASFHGTSTMGVGACYSVGAGVSPSFTWTASGNVFYGTGQIVIQP